VTDSSPDPLGSLLQAYRADAHLAYAPPPAASIADRGRRRGRRQVTTTTVAAASLAITIGAALAFGPGDRDNPTPVDTTRPPVSVAPSAPPTGASPTPSQAPAAPPPTTSTAPPLDIRKTNLAKATIALPRHPTNEFCPTGTIDVRKYERFKLGEQVEAYGDLDGDGSPEAAIRVGCEGPGDSGDGAGQLLVVAVRGQSLVGLGYVGPEGFNYTDIRITAGRLRFALTDRYPEDPELPPATQQRAYRWNGSTFTQVSGPTAVPS
jgi:hypothetical protein